MQIINGTKSNFSELTSKSLAIAYFYGPSCVPCKQISAYMSEIASENNDINVVRINIEEEPEIALSNSVTSLPTVIIMKDGMRMKSITGSRKKEHYQDELHCIKNGL